MKMKRLVWGFFTIAAVALLAGCGGGGGTSLMVGGERATQSAIDALETSLSTANDNVTRLTGELATANDNLDTASGDVTRLTGELATANDNLTAANDDVTRLTGELATANDNLDTASGEVTRLTGELATANDNLTAANGDVTRLTGELATANDNLTAANDDVTRLTDELATANGDVTDLMAERDSYKNRAMGFETAQNARDDATGAAAAAATALQTATDNMSLITTRASGVAGDSATATANARSVLDAKADADAAVVTAQGAVDSAEAALAPDADTTDALTRALNAAIAVANAQLAAAQASANAPALTTAVQAVTGIDEDNPMTPEDHGRMVAEDITAALEPTSDTDGFRARGTHGNAAPDATTFPDAVMMDDHQGATWAEIVGAPNIMSMRIAASGGSGTELVDATSLAGMAVASTFTDNAPTGPVADGMEYTNTGSGINYMGIPGRAFCVGSECNVDADNNLIGGWYFTPDDVDQWYVGTTDAANVTTYAAETLYAQFGHWLADDGSGNTVVNTYTLTTGNTGSLDLGTANFTDTTATYSGRATGMSSTWTTDEDSVVTSMASGAFTATVNLKATFDDTPILEGTIDNFAGPAVDSAWSVALESKALDASNANFTDGVTTATGRDGVWTAQGYGVSAARPTGFFGGFNAHFSDGHAAGAYAARE